MKLTLADKQRIRDHLGTLHSDAELKTWFDPLHLNFSESGTLEVRFPHVLFFRWFGKDRQKRFERDLTALSAVVSRIVYVRPEDTRQQSSQGFMKMASVPGPEVFADAARFSFDAFIYNKKNEFPVSMAREVATSPGNRAHVPFVICGKGSCGKTHLLRAMAGSMAEHLPSGSIYFGTVEELESLFRENPATFKRKMLRYKALFLDNGQVLSAFPDLQQELVFIAEKYKEKEKPFVLSLDDNVDQTALNPKLRSRLESGLTVTVKKPDLDVRLRYAKAQCVANRIHLKKEIILSLAQRFQNLSAIQGVISKALAFQKKTGKPVTETDMEKILASTYTLAGKQPSAQAIISQVAESFSLSPEEITGNDRRTEASLPRQVAMYLCRELLGAPYSSVGAYFNGKNHATVIYACKKITKIIKGDKDMNKRVAKIRKKFLTATG